MATVRELAALVGGEVCGVCVPPLVHLSPRALTNRATTYGHGITTRSPSTTMMKRTARTGRPSLPMLMSCARPADCNGSQTARSHTTL